MDGLSALTVAASVAQFIEFGLDLVTKSKEIYKSANGASIKHGETEAATKRLVQLSDRLKTSANDQSTTSGNPSPEDQALRTVCDRCIVVSNELLQKLNKLKVHDQGKLRRYKSFRQAIKSVCSKSAVDDMATRLKELRQEIEVHVLVSLSERFNNLSLLNDEHFTTLDKTMQRLIEPLLRYLTKIHDNLAEIARRTQDLSSCEDPTQVRNRTSLHAKEVSYEAEHRKKQEAEERNLLAYGILISLVFPEMSHRELEIADAHKNTFSWLLRDMPSPDSDEGDSVPPSRPWNSFIEWLRKGTGIYWVSGKAGSGKSTLVRYMIQNPQTLLQLSLWSPQDKPILSTFYFWNSGTPLQRSQEGLLRSLLHRVLLNRQDLIPLVFPDEWALGQASLSSASTRHERQSRWNFSTSQLEAAFLRMTSLANERLKFFFLVDGLDEHQGDSEKLVELFKTSSQSPFVKFCLSSRPWLEFDEAFKDYPKLNLQDLTHNDIQNYVREKLLSSERFTILEAANPHAADRLSRTVVNKANGVFLWVQIVTRSLLDGLRNRDDISDLQARLDLLPTKLSELYQHMLNRIDPIYITRASQIFQVYNSAIDLNLHPTSLELDLAVSATYPNAVSNVTVELMTDLEINDRCDRMSAHLKSRCQGLLEVHDILDRNWESVPDPEDNLKNPRRDYRHYRDWYLDPQIERLKPFCKVSYLHRTVKDFLQTSAVRAKLQQQTALLPNFEPNLSLLMGYVINMKRGLFSFYAADEAEVMKRIHRATRDAILLAGKLEADVIRRQKGIALLEEFHKRGYFWGTNSKLLTRSETLIKQWKHEILVPAVHHGLWNYVSHMLLEEEEGCEPNWRWLIRCALCRCNSDDHPPELVKGMNRPRPEMLKVLLQRGADPRGLEDWISDAFPHCSIKKEGPLGFTLAIPRPNPNAKRKMETQADQEPRLQRPRLSSEQLSGTLFTDGSY